jgi:hypothetical protein
MGSWLTPSRKDICQFKETKEFNKTVNNRMTPTLPSLAALPNQLL